MPLTCRTTTRPPFSMPNQKPKLDPIPPNRLHPDTVYSNDTGTQLYKLERLHNGMAYYYNIKTGGCGQILRESISDFAERVFIATECHCGRKAQEVVVTAGKKQPSCRTHATAFWEGRRTHGLKPTD